MWDLEVNTQILYYGKQKLKRLRATNAPISWPPMLSVIDGLLNVSSTCNLYNQFSSCAARYLCE